jgi:hypothetical protein
MVPFPEERERLTIRPGWQAMLATEMEHMSEHKEVEI